MPTRRNMAPQQSNIPIPLAAMVIDLRSGRNDLLKTLRLEIENLAAEKQEQQVNHWQYLADFIDFQSLPPLDPQAIKDLWERIERDRNVGANVQGALPVSTNGPHSNEAANSKQSPQLQWQAPYVPFKQMPDAEDEETVLPDTSMLTEEYQDCTHRIDTIRNKRHNALGNLGKTGRLDKNRKYARTRVIFITDAQDRDSLNSASVFAAYLKQYYRGHLEHSGYEDVLITSVISLNHPNMADAPRLLINNLRWAGRKDDWVHIDALFINEIYRADAGWQDAATQSYVTELLLYALLIVKPIDLAGIPEVALNSTQMLFDEQKVKERRELHPQTFIFGLSTIEHSTRWGRLYLNTALAAQTMQLLHIQGADYREDVERQMQSWLNEWRGEVGNAVPQDIPGDFPYRDALNAASKAAKPANEVFPERDSRRTIELRSVETIEDYADRLGKTYQPLQQDQSQAVIYAMNKLREKDESNRLVAALKRVQGVLGEKGVFSGATGCIARAKLQLEAISDVIAQYSRNRSSIEPDAMRENVLRLRDERIRALRDHCEGFPFLRGHPWLLNIGIGFTLLLCAFMCVIIGLAAYAALHHFAFARFPSVAVFLDRQLLGTTFLSVGTIMLVLLIILALFFTLVLPDRYIFGWQGRARRMPRGQTSSGKAPLAPRAHDVAWVTEITLLGALLVFAIFGFIVSTILANLADDPVVLTILGWLSGLPFWSWLALVVLLVCVIGELIHYLLWYNELLDLRQSIIAELQEQHQKNIDLIKQHLVDTVALDLLRRAGLIDGQGGRGPYYKRIVRLNTDLTEVETEISNQLNLVSDRLLEQQVTLQFREELLDIKALTAHSQKLTDDLTHEPPDLQEFAEVLLRVMGEESPAKIESQLRDERVADSTQQFWQPSHLDRRALRHIQVLTTVVATLALRIVIDIPPDDAITPLDRRFRELSDVDPDYQVALGSLLERMQNYNKEVILNTLRGQPISQDDYENQLILQALTLWSQTLWVHKDSDLDDLLKPQDIFTVLKRQGYSPQTIRDLLGVRVNPGGRPRVVIWKGEGYLIAPPSGDGVKFILSMDHRLKREMIYDLPDSERFIMLTLHRYPALPLMIPRDEPAAEQALPSAAQLALPTLTSPREAAEAPPAPASDDDQATGPLGGTADTANRQPPSGNNVSTASQQEAATDAPAPPLPAPQQEAATGAPAPPQAEPLSPAPAPQTPLDPQLAMKFQSWEQKLADAIAGADDSTAIDDPDLERPIHARLEEIKDDKEALQRFVDKNLANGQKFAHPSSSKDAFFLCRDIFAARAGQRALGLSAEQLLPWPEPMRELLGQVQDADLQRLVREDMAPTPL